MNRILSIAAAMLIGSLLYAAAESVIYETGFESAQGFQPGPLHETAGDWGSEGGYPFVIADGGASGKDGQVLESSAADAGEAGRAWLRNVDFKGAEKITVEMEVMAQSSGSAGYQANIQLGEFENRPKTKAEGTAAQVSLRGSGKIVVFDGDTEKELGEFKSGEWIKLRIEADHATKKWSVAVNDAAPVADINFRDNQVFRSNAFGLTHYSGSDAKRPCSMTVDNVKISAP